jgi:hypothetical protein
MESRRGPRAAASKASDTPASAAGATAASKTPAIEASTAMRTCQSWQGKTYERGAYQAEKFNIFHD